MRRTELFLFESAYGRDPFTAKIGRAALAGARRAQRRHGGAEFAPVRAQAGRERHRLHRRAARCSRASTSCSTRSARCCANGAPLTATIVGDGPDAAKFRAAGRAPEPRRFGELPRRHAGAHSLRARPPDGRAVARGIAALYRPRSARRWAPDHRDEGRRHSRDIRPMRPAPWSRPATRRARGARSQAGADRPGSALRNSQQERCKRVSKTRVFRRRDDRRRARRLSRRSPEPGRRITTTSGRASASILSIS